MSYRAQLMVTRAGLLLKTSVAITSLLVASLISISALASSERDTKSQPLPPLAVAVRARQSKRVKELLDVGQNPNWQDNLGISLLWVATHNNDIDTARLLVAAKADLDGNYIEGSGIKATQGDATGRTVLIKAAHRDQLKLVQFFISAGANVNKRDMFGYSALQIAAQEGNPEVVRELVQAGAAVGTQELAAAQERGDQRVLDLLHAAPVTQKTAAVVFKELMYSSAVSSVALAAGLILCGLLSS